MVNKHRFLLFLVLTSLVTPTHMVTPPPSSPVPHHDALRLAFSRVEQLYRLSLPTPTPTPLPSPSAGMKQEKEEETTWGQAVMRGGGVVISRDVSDEGSIPDGGDYVPLKAEAEGLKLGYRHRLGRWQGEYTGVMDRQRWMLSVSTFPFKSQYHIVPMSESAITSQQQDKEIRQVTTTPQTRDVLGMANVQVLSAETKESEADSGWEFLPSGRKYVMAMVGLPKILTKKVDSVKRYVGILKISEHWTSHPKFTTISQHSSCTHFFSFNCQDPRALEQPTPTPTPTPTPPTPSPSASVSPPPKPSATPSRTRAAMSPPPLPPMMPGNMDAPPQYVPPPVMETEPLPPPPPPPPGQQPLPLASPTRSPSRTPSPSASASPSIIITPIFIDDEPDEPVTATPTPVPAKIIRVPSAPIPKPGTLTIPPEPADPNDPLPTTRSFDAIVPVESQQSFTHDVDNIGNVLPEERGHETLTYEQHTFTVPAAM